MNVRCVALWEHIMKDLDLIRRRREDALGNKN